MVTSAVGTEVRITGGLDGASVDRRKQESPGSSDDQGQPHAAKAPLGDAKRSQDLTCRNARIKGMGERWKLRVLGALAGAVVGLAALALLLSSLDSTSERSGTHSRTLESQGIAFVLPPDWAGQTSNGALSGGLPWFNASKRGVGRFALGEVGNPPGIGRFRSTRLPITIRRKDWVRRHPEARPGWKLARRLFSTNGRSFSLLVHVRDDPLASTMVVEINDLLKTLVVRRPPGTDPVTLARLKRRLQLPRVAGSHCPLSGVGRRAPRTGFTLGGGPAYPVLGSDHAVVDLRDDARKGGWYLHKTLWAMSPEYPGPLLIRGARLDDSGPVRFHIGGPLRAAVLWPGSGTTRAEWRYSPGSTALRAPGCYAFQIDGTTFSRVVVFEARL